IVFAAATSRPSTLASTATPSSAQPNNLVPSGPSPCTAKAIWLPIRTSLSLSDLRSGRSTTHEYYTTTHHQREGSELRRNPLRGIRPGARVRAQDLPLPLVVHAR